MRCLVRAAVGAALILSPMSTHAQFFLVPPARGAWGFAVAGQFARPIGEFGTVVDAAWGVAFSARRHLTRGPGLALRADLSFLNYGNESRRVPLSSTLNRVLVRMRTSNNIALWTAGPELTMDAGPFAPYAHAFVGYSNFFTQSSAVSDHHEHELASTTNFRDGGLASGYGGGLRFPIRSHRALASIDIGGRMTSAGERTYLIRGDIHDQPDGSMTFTPRTSITDFWQFHVGVSVRSR